jgi:hypothetical protein
MQPAHLNSPRPRIRGFSYDKPHAPHISTRRQAFEDIDARLKLQGFGLGAQGVQEGLQRIRSQDKDERLLGAKMLRLLESRLAYEPLLEAAERESDPLVKKELLKALCFSAGGETRPVENLTRLEEIIRNETDDKVVRQALFAVFHSSPREIDAFERIHALKADILGRYDEGHPIRKAVEQTEDYLLTMRTR